MTDRPFCLLAPHSVAVGSVDDEYEKILASSSPANN